MTKLWELSGNSLNPQAERFLSSLAVDSRLLEEDLRGSLAHSRMLAACGILSQTDAAAIAAALADIAEEYEAGQLQIDPAAEDIHSFVEDELTKRAGEAGKSIHAGRSRNDQVAVDLRLYLVKQFKLACTGIKQAVETICELAEQNLDTLMPAFTHLRKAQPITLAFHLAAWCAALERDWSRFADSLRRADECPLGSAAVAGTGLPIDREMTARNLGFGRPSRNAMDATADRDACVDYAAAAASLMMHLSRYAEEIILWTSEAWNFASIAPDCRTGSSIMPQKQNPDMAELLRGKSAAVFGGLVSMLSLQKGVPLGYARDMQEDKATVFGLCDTVNASLEAFKLLVSALIPNPSAMRAALEGGYIEATDLAELLVLEGLPFRQAYRLAKQTVLFAAKSDRKLTELDDSELNEITEAYTDLGLTQERLRAWLTPEACVARRKHTGGPAPDTVRRELHRLKAWCKEAAV